MARVHWIRLISQRQIRADSRNPEVVGFQHGGVVSVLAEVVERAKADQGAKTPAAVFQQRADPVQHAFVGKAVRKIANGRGGDGSTLMCHHVDGFNVRCFGQSLPGLLEVPQNLWKRRMEQRC
jgi:hypothetical protein